MTLAEFYAIDPMAMWAGLSPEVQASIIRPLLTSQFAEVVSDDDGTDASHADRDLAAGIVQDCHQQAYDAIEAAFYDLLGPDHTALHGFSAEMLDAAAKITVKGVRGKRVLRQTSYYSQSVKIGGRSVEVAGFKNIGSADAPLWQAWTQAQVDAERVRRHPDQAFGPFLPAFVSVVDAAEPAHHHHEDDRYGRDALRLATALCEPRDDAELFDLIAQHGPAEAKCDELDEAWRAPHAAYVSAQPPRPRALYWRISDRTPHPRGRQKVPDRDSYWMLYEQADIDALREGETPCGCYVQHPDMVRPGPVPQWLPDKEAIARKAEILAAWDAWEAEKAALRDSTGLTAINDLIAAQNDVISGIEDAIFGYQPRTFAGLQAKARWIASIPCAKERSEHLLRDLCRMPPVAIAPAAQVAPSRDVIETYRTFLDQEFRWLNWETHGTPHASGGRWRDNPAGRLHGGDGPPPSSRAAAVLSLLGLMPDRASEMLAEVENASRAA